MQIAAALFIIGALNFPFSSNLDLSLYVCKDEAALQSVVYGESPDLFVII